MADVRSGVGRQVTISAGPVQLEGNLSIPEGARGIVVFAHGSGSSRFSPRNQAVARSLNARGLATLLMDLFTPEEEEEDLQTRELRFDIDFLTQRVIDAVEWLTRNAEAKGLRIGLFGSSTGAAAALIAAARRPELVHAVVSRGGRADLASEALPAVKAPVLLIVGGADDVVLDLNRQALEQLEVDQKKISIVPGATHLFEEPGALEEVSRLAGEWFDRFIGEHAGRTPPLGRDTEPLWPYS